MRFMEWFGGLAVPSVVVVAVAVLGCDNSSDPKGSSNSGGSDSTQAKVAEQSKPATQPIIPVAQMADWCPEHGVPESVCTRCNESLIAGFKAKGDWDEKHNVPVSQCFECDPTLKEKFVAAYREKYGKEPPATGEGEKP